MLFPLFPFLLFRLRHSCSPLEYNMFPPIRARVGLFDRLHPKLAMLPRDNETSLRRQIKKMRLKVFVRESNSDAKIMGKCENPGWLEGNRSQSCEWTRLLHVWYANESERGMIPTRKQVGEAHLGCHLCGGPSHIKTTSILFARQQLSINYNFVISILFASGPKISMMSLLEELDHVLRYLPSHCIRTRQLGSLHGPGHVPGNGSPLISFESFFLDVYVLHCPAVDLVL